MSKECQRTKDKGQRTNDETRFYLYGALWRAGSGFLGVGAAQDVTGQLDRRRESGA
jgi:hypothetical protein